MSFPLKIQQKNNFTSLSNRLKVCQGDTPILESMTEKINMCVNNCGQRGVIIDGTNQQICQTCQQMNTQLPFLLQNGTCSASCIQRNFVLAQDNLYCVNNLGSCTQLIQTNTINNIKVKQCSSTCGHTANHVYSDGVGVATSTCTEDQSGCGELKSYTTQVNNIQVTVCVKNTCSHKVTVPNENKCAENCKNYRYQLDRLDGYKECYNKCPQSHPANLNGKCIQKCNLDDNQVMSPISGTCITGMRHSDFYLNYEQMMGCLFGIIGAAVLMCLILVGVLLFVMKRTKKQLEINKTKDQQEEKDKLKNQQEEKLKQINSNKEETEIK